MQDPNANGFAFWWNIGFKVYLAVTLGFDHIFAKIYSKSCYDSFRLWQFNYEPNYEKQFRDFWGIILVI